MIYAFEFSAILDDKTTKICKDLDGLVVEPMSKEYYRYSPPRHYNCRSIRVEILNDEPYRPKITKNLPNSQRDIREEDYF
jgi:hypothetical protein